MLAFRCELKKRSLVVQELECWELLGYRVHTLSGFRVSEAKPISSVSGRVHGGALYMTARAAETASI